MKGGGREGRRRCEGGREGGREGGTIGILTVTMLWMDFGRLYSKNGNQGSMESVHWRSWTKYTG